MCRPRVITKQQPYLLEDQKEIQSRSYNGGNPSLVETDELLGGRHEEKKRVVVPNPEKYRWGRNHISTITTTSSTPSP